MAPRTTQDVLTTGAAAELCGVSRSTLRRAVAQGLLQSWHTPGRHLRFTRAQVEEFQRLLGRDVEVVGHVEARPRTGRRSPETDRARAHATV